MSQVPVVSPSPHPNALDLYCERLGPGLFAEPLNAVTNLAFLIAAFLAWRLTDRNTPASVRTLPILLALVGLASLSFHTMATGLTAALDSGFIAVFTHFYVVCYLRWFWGLPWRLAWLGAPALLIFSVLGALLVGGGGQGAYLVSLLALVLLAIALRWRPGHAPYQRLLLLAAGVFAVSLTLRGLDNPWCAYWSPGTHFLWHLLNSVVLFILTVAVIRAWRDRAEG